MICSPFEPFESLLCSIYNWQTLIAGLLAIAFAGLTIRQVRKQISLQQRQLDNDEKRHEAARQAKALVAKAQLPDALSSIGGYASNCFRFVWEQHGDQPQLPTEAIQTLKNVLEYVESGPAREIFELVNFYQVHNARLFRGHHVPANQRLDRMLDIVRLRALTDRLYEYGREFPAAAPEVEIGRDEMNTALRACVGIGQYFSNQDHYVELVAEITQRYPDATAH